MTSFVVHKVVTIIDCEVCKAVGKSDCDLAPQYCLFSLTAEYIYMFGSNLYGFENAIFNNPTKSSSLVVKPSGYQPKCPDVYIKM